MWSGGGQMPSDVAPHHYVPARVISVHSETDKITLDAQLTAYVSPANLHGEIIGVIVGSKKIKEGYEIAHTRQLIVATNPINIPTLLQIFGRVSRKHSHSLLPEDCRDITIFILVSTVNKE